MTYVTEVLFHHQSSWCVPTSDNDADQATAHGLHTEYLSREYVVPRDRDCSRAFQPTNLFFGFTLGTQEEAAWNQKRLLKLGATIRSKHARR